MPHQSDLIVHNIIHAANTKNKKSLTELLTDNTIIHTKDSKGFNAAYHLGFNGNVESSNFLINHGANAVDAACGVAASGSDSKTMRLLVKVDINDIIQVAKTAAMAGHQNLTDKLVNMCDKDLRDYNSVAIHAARGGHQEFAEFLLNLIVDESHRKYKEVAIGAAHSGYEAIAEYFILKKKDLSNSDYNDLAAYAAFGGHQSTAEYFLNKITEIRKRNYNRVIKAAKLANHTDVVKFFQKTIEKFVSEASTSSSTSSSASQTHSLVKSFSNASSISNILAANKTLSEQLKDLRTIVTKQGESISRLQIRLTALEQMVTVNSPDEATDETDFAYVSPQKPCKIKQRV
jgi:hypothetical protein